ncbi:(2Fe-2S)-binding protein [Aquabacter spiritensis]|uniref:Nicotinate dehydrogenase subunit A n=1 Tax=Aquabacter spiritensis TaxID=933073 RepID=A0A4R3LZ43_9HYPH|nr:(2Fe-2S)-binding protein [Aquabacter spiritensis]TCT05980.1 nicotinate dehydrogenase subunit A [Aquabacter spiritensis]
MALEIAFRVNGTPRTAHADDDAPLLHVLRNVLDLKATRFGCGAEQCGACMVLVDGAPAYACTLPAGAAAGRAVETAEGLADHPLRAAFLAEQAGQCGYCLSGILMSAKALLDRTLSPSRAEIVAALDPHLCRCGAHERMLRAVARAAATLRGETP